MAHAALTAESTSTHWECMMPEMAGATQCERLFVYGTLRRGFELHHHLERLGASFQAEAMVAGELFDLGRYPGARPVRGEGKWVRGELFWLRQRVHDLNVLDEVEEIAPGSPETSEFVRAVAEVIQNDGASCRAWIYWLGAATPAARPIASGDYSTAAVCRGR